MGALSNYMSSYIWFRIVISGTISMYKQCLGRLTSICFVGDSCFIYVICIYLRMMVSTRILYQTMFVSFDSNTTGTIIGSGIVLPYGSASMCSCSSILSFLCSILWEIVDLFVCFSLRLTASDYSFGIFSLFYTSYYRVLQNLNAVTKVNESVFFEGICQYYFTLFYLSIF